MTTAVVPGQWVKLKTAPEWGVGQVQSVIGNRVTVNFENAGKRVVRLDVVALDPVDDPEDLT